MSIRSRFLLLFSLMALGPLAVVGTLAYRSGREPLREHLGQLFVVSAERALDALDSAADARARTAQEWARLELVQEAALADDIDGRVTSFLLERSREDPAQLSGVFLRSGRVISATRPEWVRRSAEDLPFEVAGSVPGCQEAILDNLKMHHGYKIHKVADAGDTVENMVYGTKVRSNYSRIAPQIRETLEAIQKRSPKAVLFSAGGNDIAGYELEGYLNHKDSGLPILRQDYVDYMFNTVFRKAYEDFFRQVWIVKPDLPIIGHGYGRAIPDGRAVTIIVIPFSGPWLRPAFAKNQVHGAVEARNAMKTLMDTFNDMLSGLQGSHPNFHYIDLRDLIQDADWVNELHLSNGEYRRVADQLDAVIRSLS